MNILKKYYPNILVTLQFGIIGLMALFSHNFFATLYPIIIFTLGAMLGVWALKHNYLGNFNIQPKLKNDAKLITTGIYHYIRHPMYSSVILMMLSIVVATPTLLQIFLFLALIGVLFLKAKREEALWSEHDEAYEAYRKRSAYFIPFLV